MDRGTSWSSLTLCFRSVFSHWREQKWCRAGDTNTLGLGSVMASAESNPAGGTQGLLLRLHSALSEEDSRAAALTCHDIVGDLGHECMLVSTENELGKTAEVASTPKHLRPASRQRGPPPSPETPFANSKTFVIYAFATTPVTNVVSCGCGRTSLSVRLSLNRPMPSAAYCIFLLC